MRIPHDTLQPETLRRVIEEFVLREGTEYGEQDVPLLSKVDAVVSQLQAGTAIVLYDAESQTCTIAPALKGAVVGSFIALEQFLKRENFVSTGGHAKQAIQNGDVSVNDVVETRRKRKLIEGDRVCFAQHNAVVHVTSAAD